MFTSQRNLLNFSMVFIVFMTNLGDIAKAAPTDAEALVINKCREQCFFETMDNLERFQSDFSSAQSVKSCQANSDCHMCHDYCRAIAIGATDLSQSMCSDGIYCMRGCQVACTFHKVKIFDPTQF